MDFSLLHPFWAIGLPVAGSLPLGWWMARVLDPPEDRVGQGVDAAPLALLRLLGRSEPAKMGWKQYAFSLLAFNAALFVLSFVILLSQGYLPLLNPNVRGLAVGPRLQGFQLAWIIPERTPPSSSTRSARS